MLRSSVYEPYTHDKKQLLKQIQKQKTNKHNYFEVLKGIR